MDLNHLTIWPECKACSKKFAFVNTGFFKIGNCPECEKGEEMKELNKTLVKLFHEDPSRILDDDKHTVFLPEVKASELTITDMVIFTKSGTIEINLDHPVKISELDEGKK